MSPDMVVQRSDKLFDTQRMVLPLWQTIADHFYPERADFTITRNVGAEVAGNLANSYPVLARRDLANSFHAMLRDGEWFKMGVTDEEPDSAGRGWLQWGTRKLRGLIDRRDAGFTRATKEGDHDYAAFGQCVISCEVNQSHDGLLFRSWHLRDCAWYDDENGDVGGVTRRWKPELHQLVTVFGQERLHQDTLKKHAKDPFATADIRHFVMSSEMYGDSGIKEPYVSVFVDADHKHLIEAVGINHKYYIIPRFQTISGSPYAYSPATMTGLPDSRALQAMTHTLLEAGERYARPPIVATRNAVSNGLDLQADGVTWIDDDYDQRTGKAVDTLGQDRGGWPIGMQMYNDMIGIISSSFYLDKLNLPAVGGNMTAYEVQERMKQFRREALPLFAPLEAEYNGQLCEQAFTIAMDAGLLGSAYDIPDSLSGRDIKFKFISPLSAAEEENKALMFKQVGGMLAESAQVAPELRDNVNVEAAFRDAVEGIGSPQGWLHSPETVKGNRDARTRNAAIEQAGISSVQGAV